MTYSSGGLIEATDYNNRVNAINSIWGAGSGANGYGQTSTTLTTSSSTSFVTATQWASLIAKLDALTVHQSGVPTGLTQPTAGTYVAWSSILDTKVAATYTNRLNATIRGTQADLGNLTNSTTWVTSSTKEFTLTFSSTDTVRYFFNAGGLINFYLTQAAGATLKSTEWGNFYTNQIGTISFGSNFCSRSGSGGDSLTQNTNIGYYSLTTTYQTLFSIGSTSATSDYGNNYMTIEAKTGATTNIVQIRCISYDAAGDTFNDTIIGANTLYVRWTPPETTYLTNVWGTPSLATVTNTQA